MEIKNKLSVTREEGNNGRKKGKGHQGTCIKDPWTKTAGGRVGLSMGVRVGGAGENGEGKMETTVLE